jgi:hypothetical protein
MNMFRLYYEPGGEVKINCPGIFLRAYQVIGAYDKAQVERACNRQDFIAFHRILEVDLSRQKSDSRKGKDEENARNRKNNLCIIQPI